MKHRITMHLVIMFILMALLVPNQGYSIVLTPEQIKESLPPGHKTFDSAISKKWDFEPYRIRPVSTESVEGRYWYLTQGYEGSEELFSGTLEEYQLRYFQLLFPAFGNNQGYWIRMNEQVDELGEVLDPRKAQAVSGFFFASKTAFNVGTAMITGGSLGALSVRAGFFADYAQLLKGDNLQAKAESLKNVYQASADLPYLSVLQNGWPEEVRSQLVVAKWLDTSAMVLELAPELKDVVKDSSGLLRAAKWDILKKSTLNTKSIDLASSVANASVAGIKVGILWGLSELEDEFRRFVRTSDIQLAVLQSISGSIISNYDTLYGENLTAVEETKLRHLLIREQMHFYRILVDLASGAVEFGRFAREEGGIKGKSTVTAEGLEHMEKSLEEVSGMADDYVKEAMNVLGGHGMSLMAFAYMKGPEVEQGDDGGGLVDGVGNDDQKHVEPEDGEVVDSSTIGSTYTDPTNYRHANFAVTDSKYSERVDNNQACQNEFGSSYRLADWTDVVSYYKSTGSMSSFFNDLGMPSKGIVGARSLHVSRGGVESYSSTRHYFISRHDHNKPGNYLAHSNIDRYLLSLGSWKGSRAALCVSTE